MAAFLLLGCDETTAETDAGADVDSSADVDAGPPPCTDGFIDAWTDGPAMPASFESHVLVSFASHLYAIGGWNQTAGARTQVYVNSDGTWRETSPLPGALQHHGAVAHGEYLYVFGGDDGFGGTVSGAVFRARVMADGSLSTWETAGTLDAPRSLHATALVGDRVFLIGGIGSFPAGDPVVLSSIVSATLGADGSVGAFTAAGDLPEARGWLGATSFGDRVYVAGGLLDFGSGALIGSVLVADAMGDGSLGAFREVATISPRMRLGLVVAGEQLVVAGGLTRSTIASDVSSASIAADGTLGDWDFRADLPEARYAFGMARLGGSLVASGGFYQTGAFDTRDGMWVADTCPP